MQEWLRQNTRQYRLMTALITMLLDQGFSPVPTEPTQNTRFRQDHTQAILELLASFRTGSWPSPLKVFSTGPLYQPETLHWSETIDVEVLGPEEPSSDFVALDLVGRLMSELSGPADDLMLVFGHVDVLARCLAAEDVDSQSGDAVRKLLMAGHLMEAETILARSAPATRELCAPLPFDRFASGLPAPVRPMADTLRPVNDRLDRLLTTRWDLSLTGNWPYYTGLVFALYLPGVGQPLLHGGRFVMQTGETDWQGIGFTLHLDPLFQFSGASAKVGSST